MIKKILTTIIGLIGIINLTSGYFYPTTKINLPGNFVNGNIYNNITSNLDFENENGYYISINDGGNKYIIFWNGGELYNYGYYSYFNNYNQGRFKRFCSSEGTGYCTSNYTTGTALEFYDLENVNFTEMTISIQSETDDPGLCFYNQVNNKNYCTQVYDNNNNIILSGNLNIPNNTTDFSNYAGNSPFTQNPKYININTQCPTIGQLMRNMGDKYNTGLCYNNTKYFNGNTFEEITKDDIFTIFNDNYENYTNRISIYRNNCTNANTTETCQRAFSGEYKKYSIISNAINSNVDEKKLWNYCNLGLNYDTNATTCTASGYIKEELNTEERIESLIGTTNEIPTPDTTSKNIFTSLCEEGENCYTTNRNFFESLVNIYNKIISIFEKREGVQGIIPPYILRITFITILFTILFKK